MKKTIYTILGAILFTVISCGPSEQQKQAAEKAKMDSVKKATETGIRQQEAEQRAKDSAAQNAKVRDERQAKLIMDSLFNAASQK